MPKNRSFLNACLIPALWALAGPLSGAPAFTLEQVLASPFPSELHASPVGGKVAWVANARGVRNVWVAESPAFEGRKVTSYQADEGIDITELRWSPDANTIVYVRGEAANGKGEHANPQSNPAGILQEVCVVHVGGGPVAGGQPKVLGQGAAPAIAPDSKSVAFVWKSEIWFAPLDGHAKPEQLIHARGRADTLRWSPDGTGLAFVSDRGDHSFIAIYTVAQKTLKYVDASVDEDAEPVWSPDGKQIAFVRTPASREAFAFGPKRAAQPWSIRVADTATGKGRQIWKAQEGPGSRFWPMVADDQLLWADGDRLIFPWEREGWLHLYATSVRDGGATLLTPGEFEVEHVGLSPDRKQLVFSSNQGDVDRRHIWKTAASGEAPQPITGGSGVEWSPVLTSDGRTVILRSTAQIPAEAALVEGSNLRALVPLTGFPSPAMVTPQPVVLSSADGMRIHGQLFLPPASSQNAKHPAVIFFHGGSRRQMLLGWHYMFYYHQAYAFNQYLASQGYVVLSVNYRSGIGYGLDFREAKDYGATGASEYNDVIGAGLYLRGRADVDPARIGLWGGSYGGYLTALGLARASDLFAVGVDFHGVHDWNPVIRVFAPGYDPEKQREAAKLAFDSSPMAYVKTWRSPVLLIHGDDDRNVPFSQTVMLAEALRDQHVPFEQLIFPDEIHDLLVHEHWLSAYHAADAFLAKYLKK